MKTTPEYESTVARSKSLEAAGLITGNGYDLPDGAEVGPLLVTLASLVCLAKNAGQDDHETREAENRHADKLFGTAIDDLRMALAEQARDAAKAERERLRARLLAPLTEVANAHAAVRHAMSIGKRRVVVPSPRELLAALDRLAAAITGVDDTLAKDGES
jgi:hypothetical protein